MTDTATPPLRPPGGAVPVRSVAPSGSAQTMVIVGVVVVLALYFGRGILVPLALSILLAFVLAPLVSRLRRWHLGRIPSVLLAVLAAISVFAGIFTILGYQAVDLAENLPKYEDNLSAKIRALRPAPAEGGFIERTTETLKHLGQELKDVASGGAENTPPQTPPNQTGPNPGLVPGQTEPIPVRIEAPPPNPFAMLTEFGGPLVSPLGTAGMVLLFVVFILLQQEDLRDRLIRLAGANDLRRTTEAMDEAGERVTRYLVTQLILNLLYGIPIGVGLWLIGIPNAALWGLLATTLRFIPYLGPVLAAILPITLSFAVDPGWTLPLLTLALFLGIELFSNNVLEPWLYGTSTGLSSFAIIVAAIFWTSLWGPLGLLLATPLTVVMVVLGRHVRQLEFLAVLLGNAPPLPPAARIYQRLLARDPDEAAEIADEDQRPDVTVTYEQSLLPALMLAEADRSRGNLDEDTLVALRDGMEAVATYFADAPDEGPDTPPPPPPRGRVLCIAGRSHLDEAAGLLLADLLARDGWQADTLPCDSASPRRIRDLPRGDIRAVLLSYLTTGTGRHAQRLAYRLRRYFGPGVPILLGMWDGGTVNPAPTAPDAVANTLSQARNLVDELGPRACDDAIGVKPAAAE